MTNDTFGYTACVSGEIGLVNTGGGGINHYSAVKESSENMKYVFRTVHIGTKRKKLFENARSNALSLHMCCNVCVWKNTFIPVYCLVRRDFQNITCRYVIAESRVILMLLKITVFCIYIYCVFNIKKNNNI